MLTIEKVLYVASYIFKENAPVRTKPLGAIKYSPYPGNLKNNGIVPIVYSASHAVLRIGGEAAPYARITETRSKKPGWQKKSLQETAQRIATEYNGRVV